MSYNDEDQTFNDTALERFTAGTMEDVVRHYHDRLTDGNICKLIERGVGKKLSPWIPEKYTEVDIQAMVGTKYTSVIAEFMTDEQTMMVVVHEEVNSPEKKCPSKMKAPTKLGVSSRECGNPLEEGKPYDPTSLTEDFFFGDRFDRGSKVETLPDAHIAGKAADLIYFNTECDKASRKVTAAQMFNVAELMKAPQPYSVGFSAGSSMAPEDNINYAGVSSLDVERAQIPINAMGTSGWSAEITHDLGSITGMNMPTSERKYQDLVNAGIFDDFDINGYGGGAITGAWPEDHCVEFTLDDLDELTDLINEVQSEVMTFR